MPLRIAIICHPTYGGSGAVAMEVATALVDRGHEVHLVSYATPFRHTGDPRILFHEVDVPAYPVFHHPPYAMALSSKLAEVTERHDLQILHAHYAIPHSVSALLAREISGRRNLKVVTTLHGTDITLVGSDPSYRPVTRYALTRSDAVTAVSHHLVRETQAKLCSECRPTMIPNFLDTELWVPGRDLKIRRRFAKDDESLLLHVSNFRPVKRVSDVLDIFARVAEQRPARLVLVGDGPDRPALEEATRLSGLEDRTTFTGFLPDARCLLRQADAFLLPSDGESFGLAALEAMACGVFVVGARAGGLPEVVRDGSEGLLSAVGDTAEMASRLLAVLGEPDRARSMGQAARARAVDTFDSRIVVPHYERLLTELAER